jgi:hypothetical protein
MDFGATISRAIKITWNYKILWILGFLAALGTGGGGSPGGANFTSPQSFGNTFSRGGNLPPWIQQLTQHPEPLIAAASVFACLVVIIGLVLAVVGIISRGGLIAGVQQVETEGTTTFGGAWKAGAARFWSLLGLNLLLAIPMIILVVILVVIFAVAFGGIIAAAIATNGRGTNNSDAGAIVGLLGGGITVMCCLLCVVVLYGLLTEALTTFGERAIVIEKLGVMASISRAWGIFRANLGNIILLALIMGAITFAISLVTGAIALAVLVPTMLPAILELSRGGTPGVATIILGVAGVIVGIILGAIVRTLFITFNSTAWTLAFRQFTGIAPAITAPPPAAPSLPAA